MSHGNEKYTDEELKAALIKCNGQPTKAAKMLRVTYVSVYLRIRKNPELLDVQKAYRARTFQRVSNMTLKAFLTGTITEPETDKEGKIIKGKTKKVKVPMANRLALIPNLMQTFKGEEGIRDKIELGAITPVIQTISASELTEEQIKNYMNAPTSNNTST